MKTTMFFIFTLLLQFSAAQVFEKEINTGNTFYVESLHKTSDSGYVVFGSSDWYNTIVKFDINGNVTWAKKYSDFLQHATKLGANKFLSYNFELNNNLTEICLFDSAGFLLSAITVAESLIVQSLHSTYDGGTIAVGQFQFQDNAPTIIKTDSAGAIQWTKEMVSTTFGYHQWYAIDIIQTYDSGYVLIGEYNPSDTLNAPRYSMFVRLDHLGNILWAKSQDNYTFWGSRIHPIFNSGFIVAGNSSSDYNYFDTAGVQQWAIRFPDSLPNFDVYDFILTSDSNFLFAGNNACGGTALMKTDLYGNILWLRTYPATPNGNHKVVEVNGDGYLIAANRNDTAKNIVLIKTDGNGLSSCDSTCTFPIYYNLTILNHPDIPPVGLNNFTLNIQQNILPFIQDSAFNEIDYCMLVKVEPMQTDKQIFTLSPNPFSSEILLDFSEAKNEKARLNILNLTGQLVIEQEILLEDLTLDLSSLSKGIYVIRVITDKYSFTSKIIKQ